MPEIWLDQQRRRLSLIVSDPTKAKEIMLAKLGLPRKVGFITNDGHFAVGNLPDIIVSLMYQGHPHEPEVTAYMKHILKPGDSVINAGAHIGTHAVDASYLVGLKGRVICYEPTPTTYKVLKSNCVGRDNMTAIQMAVGSKLGTAELTELGVGLSACNTLTDAPRVSSKVLARCRPHKRDVQVVTIDDCLDHDQSGKCDLVILDVEGSEMDALKGAAKTLGRSQPAVIMEVGDLGRTQSTSTRACLFFLAYMGYVFFEYDFESGIIVPHTIQEAYPDSGNLLCKHKERLAQ